MTEQKPMYFLSLFAIFKNEAVIFREWIEHYLNEGVEHFYLIDNGSNDNYKEIIEKYNDKITLFIDDTKHSQMVLYNQYFLPKLEETEWAILCDFDEFIWATDGTIASVLRNVDDSIAMIQVPWTMFGSSGHIEQPDYVVPSFTKRMKADDEFTMNCKSIARSKLNDQFHIHLF